jgi:hypothetical protein
VTSAINTAAIGEFLLLLQRTGPIVFIVFPQDPTKPCIHVPGTDASIPTAELERLLQRHPTHSLGLIINPALPQPTNWGTLPEHLNKAGHPKAWGASNAHISHAIACWAEGDGGLPIEQQLALPAAAGLPAPSFAVNTGGKSIHHYWVMAPGHTLTPDQFRNIQRRLVIAMQGANAEAGMDKSLHNPCRVMRLPGGHHPKTGNATTVIPTTVTGELFNLDQLDALLPQLSDPAGRGGSTTTSRPLFDSIPHTAGNGWFSRLSPADQRAFAIEMLAVAPIRQQPGTGTRHKAIQILAGLIHHFGRHEAIAITTDANWAGPYWDPAHEATSIGDHDRPSGIASLIEAARANGWQHPIEHRRQRQHQRITRNLHLARLAAASIR